jgi:ABC-type lipoprotein release transport system permease subunit
MATMVKRRTRELGIRMALGATGGDVGRMVVTQGLLIALFGTVAGIAGARATEASSPGCCSRERDRRRQLLGVIVLVLAVAILASLIPARAGAMVEPSSALRVDD